MKTDDRCAFCSSGEGRVCGKCSQTFLLMDKGKLKKAHALAQDSGCTEKAEILESYIEEVLTMMEVKQWQDVLSEADVLEVFAMKKAS